MTHNGTENARLVCPDWDERDCPRMCGEDGCHMAQSVVPREPDESDDLPAIVRYHGAREVLDAVLLVAEEVYGKDDALPKVHLLLLERARFRSAAPSEEVES